MLFIKWQNLGNSWEKQKGQCNYRVSEVVSDFSEHLKKSSYIFLNKDGHYHTENLFLFHVNGGRNTAQRDAIHESTSGSLALWIINKQINKSSKKKAPQNKKHIHTNLKTPKQNKKRKNKFQRSQTAYRLTQLFIIWAVWAWKESMSQPGIILQSQLIHVCGLSLMNMESLDTQLWAPLGGKDNSSSSSDQE